MASSGLPHCCSCALAPSTTISHLLNSLLIRSAWLQDILTDDEIISDSYALKLVDDAVYEVEGKKITPGAESFGQ